MLVSNPTARPESADSRATVRLIREALATAAGTKSNFDIDRAAERVTSYLIEALRPTGSEISTFESSTISLSRSPHDSAVIEMNDIPFRSTCPHHLLPFFGTINVTVLPDERVMGLSRIPELVDALSAQLNLQEDLGTALVDALERLLTPLAITVQISAIHTCVIVSRPAGAINPIVTTLRRVRGRGPEVDLDTRPSNHRAAPFDDIWAQEGHGE